MVRYRLKQQIVATAAITLATVGFAVAVWAVSQFTRSRLVDYATFVAGTSGPLWTASGVLFVYVAYLAQREQLDRQEDEIRASSDELRRQNFDRTFFHLLDLRIRIIDGMQIRKIKPLGSSHDLLGRSALHQLASYLISTLRNKDQSAHQWEAQGDRPYNLIQAMSEGYDEFYKDWHEFVVPLNGNAQFLLSFVESIGESHRASYRSMLRAHLSIEEIVMFLYHAWWLDHKAHDSEVRKILKTSGLLDNLGELPVIAEHREILLAMSTAPPN